MLDPVSWCVWASSAADTEFVEINARRFRRRFLLLDGLMAAPGLLRDAVFPPSEYLRWRWPESKSTVEALARHLSRVVGKLG
jgi:predicted DCC family thiol-disulfide oxidoreductase YuxK